MSLHRQRTPSKLSNLGGVLALRSDTDFNDGFVVHLGKNFLTISVTQLTGCAQRNLGARSLVTYRRHYNKTGQALGC
jgi:hypothetical protein